LKSPNVELSYSYNKHHSILKQDPGTFVGAASPGCGWIWQTLTYHEKKRLFKVEMQAFFFPADIYITKSNEDTV